MSTIKAAEAREALRQLPEGTSHGDTPKLEEVYLPRSHLRAMDPDALVVTGMRGAGKTFWWGALQDKAVRAMLGKVPGFRTVDASTEVRTGFGVRPDSGKYPGKDTIRQLLDEGHEARIIWRTVAAWQFTRQFPREDHPLRQKTSWAERVEWAAHHPESTEALFEESDRASDQRKTHTLLLFDGLDRSADDWKTMYVVIRGLLQTALDLRSYRRLRVKVFLRSDQLDEGRIADFPDASKVLASSVDLSWPRRELYGLLWHSLANGDAGKLFRAFLGDDRRARAAAVLPTLFNVPRRFVADEDRQREKFHALTGPWMGSGPRRGFPYTWIPNHLADTAGRVSPRSFLAALRAAAEDTAERHPDWDHALHYESIKRGVQEASRIRVDELREDYPWVHRLLNALKGMVVPLSFAEIEERWRERGVIEDLDGWTGGQEVKVKLPPGRPGPEGAREGLETLGVFQRLYDGRVNIPDVYRVGYGLGRRGGVKPVR